MGAATLNIVHLLFLLQYVFSNVNTESVIQKLSANDGSNDDSFGNSVSIYDNYALVGAQYNHSAYIFERILGNWTQVAKLSPSDASGSRFGKSVSIYNHTALIGAWKYNSGAGSAYIFTKNASDKWVQETMLFPSDPTSVHFGATASIYNEYAVIGDSLRYYLFEKINGNWTEVTTLRPTNQTNMVYGEHVSIHKNYALVGADGFDIPNSNGAAFVYEKVNETWTQIAKLQALNATSTTDRFGFSVSIYNKYALIGAINSDDNGHNSGSAYVFYHIDGGVWTQVTKLLPEDGDIEDEFGISVSIYNKYALVGARSDNDKGDNSGSAYIFERRSIDHWVQTAKIVPNDGSANDLFGSSVSLHKGYGLIGAPVDTVSQNRLGSAYAITNSFTLFPTAAPTQPPTIAPTQPPTVSPTDLPTQPPTISPTGIPTEAPTIAPTSLPTISSLAPTYSPSVSPTFSPSLTPSFAPSESPIASPSSAPSRAPSLAPSYFPTFTPTNAPIVSPTQSPSREPTPSPLPCPYNSFKPMSGECFTCNSNNHGYECQGGSIVNVEYGYWVSANNDSVISLQCPAGQCCAKHSGCEYNTSRAHVSQTICANHRNISSLTCSRCNDSYFELLGTSACGQCNHTNYTYIILVFIAALMFTVFLLFCLSRPTQVFSDIATANDEIHWRRLIWYDQRTLVTVLVFKIYLYYPRKT
eukprot:837981_1